MRHFAWLLTRSILSLLYRPSESSSDRQQRLIAGFVSHVHAYERARDADLFYQVKIAFLAKDAKLRSVVTMALASKNKDTFEAALKAAESALNPEEARLCCFCCCSSSSSCPSSYFCFFFLVLDAVAVVPAVVAFAWLLLPSHARGKFNCLRWNFYCKVSLG